MEVTNSNKSCSLIPSGKGRGGLKSKDKYLDLDIIELELIWNRLNINLSTLFKKFNIDQFSKKYFILE